MGKNKNAVSLAAVHTHTHTHTHFVCVYQHNQQINQLKQKGDNILSNVLMVNDCSCKNTYRWGGGSSYLFKACRSHKESSTKEVQY